MNNIAPHDSGIACPTSVALANSTPANSRSPAKSTTANNDGPSALESPSSSRRISADVGTLSNNLSTASDISEAACTLETVR